MAYFAQFELNTPAVAMVTASHNDNGWTGVKMGAQRPVTFGPEEMGRLKEIVLSGKFREAGGGSYRFHENFRARYLDDLARGVNFSRKMKVVAACGNGTAGAFAPRLLQRLGCEVVPLDTELDYTFPVTTPIRKTWKCCTPLRIRFAKRERTLGLALMETVIGAVS